MLNLNTWRNKSTDFTPHPPCALQVVSDVIVMSLELSLHLMHHAVLLTLWFTSVLNYSRKRLDFLHYFYIRHCETCFTLKQLNNFAVKHYQCCVLVLWNIKVLMSANVFLLNTSSIVCVSESVTRVWSATTLMWILSIHSI